MLNLKFFFLLGASACAQLNQFEEAITWCEKGLAVSFSKDASMEKDLSCSHFTIVFRAFACVPSCPSLITKSKLFSFHDNSVQFRC